MYTLVLFVCYLNGGCKTLPIENFASEEQCLYAMKDQGIRQGGCYPYEEKHRVKGFRPARIHSDLWLLQRH
ncbi:DUF1482 family protein [Mangrovibacter yixingensis]|uniref:DUF1482 family protein n=1 Tax=Mangrovibacter yixingensis TaxID=1529639 RepID=UPI001CFB2756|nr:DUF1482 family protein [Mangrovibacter yixingensis]